MTTKTISKKASGNLGPRFCAALVGLAKDYWKNPSPVPKEEKKKFANNKTESKNNSGAAAPAEQVNKIWLADRAQVLEKIWGEGQVLPFGEEFAKVVSPQIDLKNDASILDLSAGIGGLARRLVQDFEERTKAQKLQKQHVTIVVTGLEQDALLVKRGMALSIQAGMEKSASVELYDPLAFAAVKRYDCIIARELFYRVVGKHKLFNAISSGLKSRGQIFFTDFILDPSLSGNESVFSWLKAEKNATPMSLSEMTQEWAKLGFDVRINEDQTETYKREIIRKIGAFAVFLSKNPPAKETKPLVVRETMLWARRIAALSDGLKYCRFFAIKI